MAATNFGVVPVLNHNPAQNKPYRPRDPAVPSPRRENGGKRRKGHPPHGKSPPHYRSSFQGQTPDELIYGVTTSGILVPHSDLRYDRGRPQYLARQEQHKHHQSMMTTRVPRDAHASQPYRPRGYIAHYDSGYGMKIQDPELSGLVYYNVPNGKRVAAVQKFNDISPDSSEMTSNMYINQHPPDHQYVNEEAFVRDSEERPRRFMNMHDKDANLNGGRGVFTSKAHVIQTTDGEEQEVTCDIDMEDDPEMTLEQEQEIYHAYRDTEVTSDQQEIDQALRDLELEDYNSDGTLLRRNSQIQKNYWW